MKNSLLINSQIPNEFWIEVIDTASYLQNWLPIRYAVDKKNYHFGKNLDKD